jgi:hypothetical protein
MLRPVAGLAGWHAGRQLRTFLEAHQTTRHVQDQLLRSLLALHASTEFGRDHGFSSITTWEEFVRAVPLRRYEDFQPYMNRVLHGEFGALIPPDDRILMFSLSSGTTGEPKYIPVTNRFLDATRRGWNAWGLQALNDHRSAWLRPILQISSTPHEQTSPTGIPCGAISGLLAGTQKRIVQKFYVVPRWTSDIPDPENRYYTILRHSMAEDVSFITTANPSSTLKLVEILDAYRDRLIEDVRRGAFSPPNPGLEDRASLCKFRPNPRLAAQLRQCIETDGFLRPNHLWRLSFLANWTGGTLGLYLRRLRDLFPGVPIRDIGLVASEGRFSIPLASDTSAGAAEICHNVLEFIPAEQRETDQPQTLRPWELDVGREYFLVFSNFTGLFRYDLDDRIRVVDFLGQTPVFEFLSRGKHTANITGEKLTEHQVVEAMRRAREQTGLAVERFVLQGRFGRNHTIPFYELRVELPPQRPAEELAAVLDRALCELNLEYASKRKSDRLGPILGVALPTDEAERQERETIRSRKGRIEQYKHQYLRTDVREE